MHLFLTKTSNIFATSLASKSNTIPDHLAGYKKILRNTQNCTSRQTAFSHAFCHEYIHGNINI